jgi:hypothetical protein
MSASDHYTEVDRAYEGRCLQRPHHSVGGIDNFVSRPMIVFITPP